MLEKDGNQSLDLRVAKFSVDTKNVMKHGEGIHLPHILSGLFENRKNSPKDTFLASSLLSRLDWAIRQCRIPINFLISPEPPSRILKYLSLSFTSGHSLAVSESAARKLFPCHCSSLWLRHAHHRAVWCLASQLWGIGFLYNFMLFSRLHTVSVRSISVYGR